MSLESSSLTLRTTNGTSNTSPQQSQTPRLQNSTSTSSLFGPPHHLGTLNGSHTSVTNNLTNGNSTPTSPSAATQNLSNGIHSDSPENQLKRQSFTTDDSAPDITQLAMSCQKFSLNVNSVDNILRLNGPRRHTNSTSSTCSSLSEAWLLPRCHSQESSQTPRTVGNSISSTSDKTIKSVRKRIDCDGLTKIPDPITSRMLEKERTYVVSCSTFEHFLLLIDLFLFDILATNRRSSRTYETNATICSHITQIQQQ